MEIQGPNPLDQYQHEEDDMRPEEAVIDSEKGANLMEADHSTGFLLGDDVTVQFQQVDEDNEEE